MGERQVINTSVHQKNATTLEITLPRNKVDINAQHPRQLSIKIDKELARELRDLLIIALPTLETFEKPE